MGEREKLEAEVESLQLKMRKLKHASTMWRLDYQKETKFKYERMIMDMDTRQERDSDAVERQKLQAAEDAAAREASLVAQLKAAQATPKITYSAPAPAPAPEPDAAREQEEAERQAGMKNLAALRERIQELWAVLESDAPDKLAFVMQVEETAGYTAEVEDLYQKEVVKLTDQLPLMETVTRREFIKYRLNELKSGARGTREDKQKSEFVRELKRLNEQLSKALPSYEKKHGCMFLFKGKQYLEIMDGDAQQDASRRR